MTDTTRMLIDDFGRNDGRSALGAVWRGFSDQVMGGVSQEQVTFEVVEERRCLRLRGRVRLDNNGGFIQMALPLDVRGQALDAGSFRGLRLAVWGNGERYSVHLRSPDAVRPWQFYRASFAAPPRWTTIELPFTDFEAKALATPLDIRRLTRLGIVAAGAAFDADVAISRVELYA